MSSLIPPVTVNLNLSTGVTVSTTSPTQPMPDASGPATPMSSSFDKRLFAMAVGQTIYVNLYNSLAGINPWRPYTVGYVYMDGNALLVIEPDIVLYTGKLVVNCNLRRKGEAYADSAPGP